MNYNSSLVYEFNNIFDNIEEIEIDELATILKSVNNFSKDIMSVIYEREGYEDRSEEHTSELQSRFDLVCRLLLEKKNKLHRKDTFELSQIVQDGTSENEDKECKKEMI